MWLLIVAIYFLMTLMLRLLGAFLAAAPLALGFLAAPPFLAAVFLVAFPLAAA